MNAMDAAQIVVSALIEKLQKESTSVIIPKYPMLEEQVRTAVNQLHLLKRRLELAEELEASPAHSMSFDDQRTLELLQAIYTADDAADTLLTREAFQIRTKISGSKKRFHWPSIMSLCGPITSTYDSQTKTFEDEFREYLSSYYRLVEMTSNIEQEVGYSDVAISSSQNDHKAQQSRHLQQRWGRISDFCFNTEVVGDLNEQAKQLVKDPLSSQVIAVVGEGGSGKTTLARTAYNILLQTRKFSESAWVQVPSFFKARYVFADILKQIKGDNIPVDATVSEEELISELTKILRKNNYLIVIEDVESSQVWEAIGKGGIIFGSHDTAGSRIIITTCSEDVASKATKADSILKVGQLNNEGGWELFLQKAHIVDDVWNNNLMLNAPKEGFLKARGDDYSGLITLKEQILNVSRGLPARIVLLGGLLSTKEPSNDQWSRVIERANKIGGDIFALCFQDLPSQLKPCFLFLGLFPKGFEIPVRRLIHLWLCEGFVTAPRLDPVAETVLEDLAELYFEELVIRNMIEVKWRLDGSPKTCRMASVLYDIFSPKAADIGFFHHELHPFHDSSNREPQFGVRRMAKSLDIKIKSRTPFCHVAENLRSYIAFDTRMPCQPAMEIATLLNKIITQKGFGLLKVLDLEGVFRPVLSVDVIGKLLLLSYLGLRSTAIDSLPSSVGKLPCIETLDVKHTIIHDLPSSIYQAKKLRHLHLNWGCSSNFKSSSLPSQPPTNLQTLWGLSIDDGGVGFLKTLTGLRKLGLTCTSESSAEATAEWVSQLTKLQSLKLRSIKKETNELFDLKLPTMKTHHKLQELYFIGRQPKRSLTNVEFPPNLRMLTLSGSNLSEDPMPVLGRLPQLHMLRLLGASCKNTTMTCPSGGFPKLRALKLWQLPDLEIWSVEKGAMPCLRELEIRSCKHLRAVKMLQDLTTLKKVALIETELAVLNFVESKEGDLHLYIKN